VLVRVLVIDNHFCRACFEYEHEHRFAAHE